MAYNLKVNMAQMQFCTLLKTTIVLLVLIQIAAGRPGNFEEFGEHEDKCKQRDPTVIIVCQMCAKQTKSTRVYPMCCSNEDDVYNWCGKYINYGKKFK